MKKQNNQTQTPESCDTSSADMIGTDVICAGQMVVDCITRNRRLTSGKKNVYTADSITLSPGGDALNQATNLTRLGHRVKLVGVIGPDAAGQLLMSVIQNHQIAAEGISIDDSVTTPVANLQVFENGDRESINSPATMLGSYEPDPSVLKGTGAKILSLASLFRAPLDRPKSVIRLIRQAKEEGMTVCADTKLPTFRNMALSDLEEVLPLIDYIFPNENEAQYLTGEKDYARMTASLRDRGIHNVIIKAGPNGCFVREESGKFFQIPALPVRAVDSTGAGDSFVSGFISGLLKRRTLEECCRMGTELAAACVQHQGAT